MSLNDAQKKILNAKIISIGIAFRDEVARLIASGGVEADFGDYPLSTIIKVALENLADLECYTVKSEYINLRKF